MKVCNSTLRELAEKNKGKRIILFGIGEYFRYYLAEKFPQELIDNVEYIVDNGAAGTQAELGGKMLPVYTPDKLREEKDCVVIIGSSNYMSEMYQQLEDMNLGDGVDCYVFPLMMVASKGEEDAGIKETVFKSATEPKIDKVIHSFWFSGDKKPEAYQRCVDSWMKVCPDYQIIEWNMDNYDYEKNPFMKQAIEQRKWAFASDFARLDVVYNQGGIYLDMDVELLKPLDSLLGNEAFFTFDTQNDIDLGTFAARKGNPLVKRLMSLYDEVEFSGDMKTMNWFCQPRYIRTILQEYGLALNGDMQVIDGAVFLPRKYLVPKDSIIYELSAFGDETLAIHQYNAGWKNDDYRELRIANNRVLWEKMNGSN